MKTAEQWAEELGVNTGENVCVEIEDIKAIQDDALETASKIVLEYKYQKGSMNFNMGFVAGLIMNNQSDNAAAMPNNVLGNNPDNQKQ